MTLAVVATPLNDYYVVDLHGLFFLLLIYVTRSSLWPDHEHVHSIIASSWILDRTVMQ